MEQIYRLHYRAQLKEAYTEEQLQGATADCMENVKRLQREGKILTAALYRCEKMLFLYYEAPGEPLSVTEPVKAAEEAGAIQQKDAGKQSGASVILESGEDVQLTAVKPADFLEPLMSYLCPWPGQAGERLWVHMYYIYCHSLPESKEQWKRAGIPEKRRGRIAFLRDAKLFSYTYFHKAIVDEGLLMGDKYQSIALHENILFSYFEEPKTMTNIRKSREESAVIRDWMDVNPEAHFIHMPEGRGENFMFLPALFAMGAEDLEEQTGKEGKQHESF